mmetsp:Transcript_34688/g.75818  ORF Transcript_34688/g.75818 Transcript_34688/m.75818 type:complete len:337 (-) Transcript_34688:950-1960(-)
MLHAALLVLPSAFGLGIAHGALVAWGCSALRTQAAEEAGNETVHAAALFSARSVERVGLVAPRCLHGLFAEADEPFPIGKSASSESDSGLREQVEALAGGLHSRRVLWVVRSSLPMRPVHIRDPDLECDADGREHVADVLAQELGAARAVLTHASSRMATRVVARLVGQIQHEARTRAVGLGVLHLVESACHSRVGEHEAFGVHVALAAAFEAIRIACNVHVPGRHGLIARWQRRRRRLQPCDGDHSLPRARRSPASPIQAELIDATLGRRFHVKEGRAKLLGRAKDARRRRRRRRRRRWHAASAAAAAAAVACHNVCIRVDGVPCALAAAVAGAQ